MIKTVCMVIFLMMLISRPTHLYAQVAANTSAGTKGSRVLIVYLSRTQNTKAVARLIQQQTGGILSEIRLQKPYPANYEETVAQVAQENAQGTLPALQGKIADFNKYDTVFIGFPTWGMQLPPPIKTFLKQYNLSGKTLIPFNTNAGYGAGNTFETVKALCPNSRVLTGYTTKGGIERDGQFLVIKGARALQIQQEIADWLSSLKIAVSKTGK